MRLPDKFSFAPSQALEKHAFSLTDPGGDSNLSDFLLILIEQQCWVDFENDARMFRAVVCKVTSMVTPPAASEVSTALVIPSDPFSNSNQPFHAF